MIPNISNEVHWICDPIPIRQPFNWDGVLLTPRVRDAIMGVNVELAMMPYEPDEDGITVSPFAPIDIGDNKSMIPKIAQITDDIIRGNVGWQPIAGVDRTFVGIALPLVRRTYGSLLANDLVSVQPMNMPTGLTFYLDFQVGTPERNNNNNDTQNSTNSRRN